MHEPDPPTSPAGWPAPFVVPPVPSFPYAPTRTPWGGPAPSSSLVSGCAKAQDRYGARSLGVAS